MTRAPLDQRLEDADDLRTEIERILRHTGKRRRKIEQQRSEAAGALGAAVRAAAGIGMSKTRIAEVSGLSRQTVHEMLRD